MSDQVERAVEADSRHGRAHGHVVAVSADKCLWRIDAPHGEPAVEGCHDGRFRAAQQIGGVVPLAGVGVPPATGTTERMAEQVLKVARRQTREQVNRSHAGAQLRTVAREHESPDVALGSEDDTFVVHFF